MVVEANCRRVWNLPLNVRKNGAFVAMTAQNEQDEWPRRPWRSSLAWHFASSACRVEERTLHDAMARMFTMVQIIGSATVSSGKRHNGQIVFQFVHRIRVKSVTGFGQQSIETNVPVALVTEPQ